MKDYIKLLRLKHYLKNVLILLPFICGGQLLNSSIWLKIIPGFFAFGFLSSVIYILNDLKDKEKDKNHPTKCQRPIASGKISVRSAIITAVIMILLSAVCNFLTFSSWLSWLVLFIYLVLNIGYSSGLKKIPVIDVCILVSGFFLRTLYGSFITGISLSNWMYLTVMMLSFYLGFGKRRNELIKIKNGETRDVLKYYNQNFLDKFMYLCLTVTLIFYSLWCVDPVTIANIGNRLIWTIPFVMIIFMKYSLDIEGVDSDGDPVNVVLGDKILLGLIALFSIAFALLIYL